MRVQYKLERESNSAELQAHETLKTTTGGAFKAVKGITEYIEDRDKDVASAKGAPSLGLSTFVLASTALAAL